MVRKKETQLVDWNLDFCVVFLPPDKIENI